MPPGGATDRNAWWLPVSKSGGKVKVAIFAAAVLAVLAQLLACETAAGVEPDGVPTAPPATAYPKAFPAIGSGRPTAGPALFREMAFAYWAAFNDYDIERVLDYLEPSYRQQQENQIRSDLGRLKRFRVKLGVSEQTAPTETGPGVWEMLLLIKEPLGTRVLRMAYQQHEDHWYVSHAEEVN